MLSAAAAAPGLGSRLEALLDRVNADLVSGPANASRLGGSAFSNVGPDATLMDASLFNNGNISGFGGAGVLGQISLVTDTGRDTTTASAPVVPPKQQQDPLVEYLFSKTQNKQPETDIAGLIAAQADRMRIWGRVDAADAFETMARDIVAKKAVQPILSLLLSLAATEGGDEATEFDMPDFSLQQDPVFPLSSAWPFQDFGIVENSLFSMGHEGDFDLAPLYADDETQIDAEEEARELAREQKERADEFVRKWTAGKAWGEKWVKDITDATYDPGDPLSLAPVLANHLHIHHHSRPIRRFLPPSLLVSQSLFALGPAGASWLFPKPIEDEDDEMPPIAKDAAVLDLSEAALRGVLEEVGAGVEAVRMVRSWTEKLRDPKFVKEKCPTLQALLSSLSRLLGSFDEKIAALDIEYRKTPQDVPSVLGLASQLSPDLDLISTFIPLLNRIGSSLYFDAPELSSLILSEIYLDVNSNRLTWPASTIAEWMRVWADTMLPMIKWMESWIGGSRRWEGGYWVRRDADPTMDSGFRYDIEKDALPSFMDPKMASKLLSVGRTALHLRKLQVPISAPSFQLELPVPSAGPFKSDINAAIRRCIGETGETIVNRFWEVLQTEGMKDAFERVWGIGLGMDVDYRDALLDGVVGKNPLVWRNETHLNRILSSHLASSTSPVMVRWRVAPVREEIEGMRGWDGITGEWKIPYPLSAVLPADTFRLVSLIGGFIMKISHARKIATDIDYLKLNRNNPNIWSSSGRVVHKLRVSLRLAMIAVAEGLQSHFLTTIISPELEKFRERLASSAHDPDEMCRAHMEMLTSIFNCCLLNGRNIGIHGTITEVLGLYTDYEMFGRHYDEGTISTLSEGIATLEARHAKEDRDDVEAGLDDEEIYQRRKQRDVERRRLIDTIMIRAFTKLRGDLDLGIARIINNLETLDAFTSKLQVEGLIFTLRNAMVEVVE